MRVRRRWHTSSIAASSSGTRSHDLPAFAPRQIQRIRNVSMRNHAESSHRRNFEARPGLFFGHEEIFGVVPRGSHPTKKVFGLRHACILRTKRFLRVRRDVVTQPQ